jgi:hypothetical protein
MSVFVVVRKMKPYNGWKVLGEFGLIAVTVSGDIELVLGGIIHDRGRCRGVIRVGPPGSDTKAKSIIHPLQGY